MRERRSFGRRTERREGGFRRSSGGRGFGGGFRERGRGGFGERSFPRREFTEAPIKEGEEYNVSISEVSRRGDGITRIENFVVFVPNTKKGDNVRIRIKELRGRSAVGEVITKGSAEPEAEVVEEEAEEVASDEESEAEVEKEEDEEDFGEPDAE